MRITISGSILSVIVQSCEVQMLPPTRAGAAAQVPRRPGWVRQSHSQWLLPTHTPTETERQSERDIHTHTQTRTHTHTDRARETCCSEHGQPCSVAHRSVSSSQAPADQIARQSPHGHPSATTNCSALSSPARARKAAVVRSYLPRSVRARVCK